jgi:hypothetical protein
LFFILELFLLGTFEQNEKSNLKDLENTKIISLEPHQEYWPQYFTGGLFLGALIASLLGGSWKLKIFSEETDRKFFLSPIMLFIGGFMMTFGLYIVGFSFFGQWKKAIQFNTSAWFFLLFSLLIGIISNLLLNILFSFKSNGGK